jgi:magnesium-transporting ATPase (P-type)
MGVKAIITKTINWHAIGTDVVFDQVASQPGGLTQKEAEKRLAEHGANRLRPVKKRSQWSLLLSQFKNVLIYVLIVSAAITALIGHWIDAAVIAGVVIINAIIGFIQEGKAEKAIDAIRELLSSQATVLRDGKRISLPAEELVPGDVVFLQSGDRVPADLRLFNVKNLRIDEATLAGESIPVEKSIAPVKAKALMWPG